MAGEKTSLSWILFMAMCLVVVQSSHSAEIKRSRIFKRNAAAQAPAPAPAAVPAPAAAPASAGAPAPAAAPAAAASGKKCQKPLDVVLVLDSSEKVGKLNWEKIINATIAIVSNFDMNYTRVGMIQYQSYPETTIKLRKFHDEKMLADTLKKIFYKSGGKRTDLALNATGSVFQDALVRYASKIVILVTGGPSANVYIDYQKFISGADLLATPTEQLHNGGVAVYAIGVQDGLSDEEKKTMTEQLGIIGSKPTNDHVFEEADYDKLLADVANIANKSCIVNGGWSAWSPWSECRHPCMVKMRTRDCNNPVPENGGLNCTGSKVEQYPCGTAAECQSTPKPVPSPSSGAVVYGKPDAKDCANGVEAVKLLKHQLSASSIYSEGSNDVDKTKSREDHMPAMGQVNSTEGRGAWCAEHTKALTNDTEQYIQVDLGSKLRVGMVETQGQYFFDNYVGKFSLKCSVDGINWITYGKVLTGNTDRDTLVDNYLETSVEARYLRFNPKEWNTNDICIRIAVYKCRDANLVPQKDLADKPEDAWADKWAIATRKSLITKNKGKNSKVKRHSKRQANKKH